MIRLENVLKTYGQDEYIGLDQDVLKTSSEDEDERRLQDVFKMSSSRRMFAGYSHILKGVLDICDKCLDNITD